MRYLILDTNQSPPTEYPVGSAAEAKTKVDSLFAERAGITKDAYLEKAAKEVGCEPKDLEPLFYQLTFKYGFLVGKLNEEGRYEMRESLLLEEDPTS